LSGVDLVTRTRRDLSYAAGLTIPDVIKPGLRVLFCGINPGLMSGALGQHFARPGNRFWKVLHLAGFTDRVLSPAEQWSLLDRDIGVTNLVPGTSRSASDLNKAELREGALDLARKVTQWRPALVAVLGMQAFRIAFRRPDAIVGEQSGGLSGARLWLLPNPSGLQARYTLAEMIEMFTKLRLAAGLSDTRPSRPPRA
jgi:TDG/mug DNA glycosylase family protein